MKPSVIVIKKYGNRRLYDTTSSRYVNLEDLAGHIRAGREVQVVDAKSGQDLTRVILTQIITEDAKDKPTGLPLELLRQLMKQAMLVAAPLLIAAALLSFLLSLVQTLTSLQDQSLTAVPRLLAVAVILLVGMPWFLERMADYTRMLLVDLRHYLG